MSRHSYQYDINNIEREAAEWSDAKDVPLVSALLAIAERLQDCDESLRNLVEEARREGTRS